MNIIEAYQKYQIMPQLAEHQLRVAGVAKLITDNFRDELDRDNVVKACLLHDMGNIIKFDLNRTADLYPELFIEPQERKFWEKVRQEYLEKYGTDEHQATVMIAKELGTSKRVVELIDAVGFLQGIENAKSYDLGKKFCSYCDSRVAPNGVVSLEERLKDGHYRYSGLTDFAPDSLEAQFDAAIKQIEKQIFKHCNITPADITEQAVAPIIKELRNFEI